MDGMAASSSVRKARGWRNQRGHSSDRKIAMPRATGMARSRARIDE
jgi:hypothetical protein